MCICLYVRASRLCFVCVFLCLCGFGVCVYMCMYENSIYFTLEFYSVQIYMTALIISNSPTDYKSNNTYTD